MLSGTVETTETLKAILKTIDEGIHVVDSNSMTIFYNNVAAELDGLTPDEVHNYHVLDAFPSLTKETSTLLKVIQTGKPLLNQHQSYRNRKGIQIDTMNSTLPLWLNGELIGAVEVAKDITKIKQLSDQLIDLQAKMKNNAQKSYNHSSALFEFTDILTVDASFQMVKDQCVKASETNSPIMIYGETGTGKEMFVQAIHHTSKRKNKPFIAQNCAAIPSALLEGILFGTTKGSFTGAVDRPGIFELADEGTLFLDEINSMPNELQAKLLRVLQEGVVQRIGSSKPCKVNVRVVSALNENPEICLEQGKLRRDLFYRLNVVYFELPPLRHREKDIPYLINYFISQFNQAFMKKVNGLTSQAEKVLIQYHWPGNVRELKHAIEHAMNFAEDHSLIDIHLLPKHVRNDIPAAENQPQNEFTAIPPLRKAMDEYEKHLIQTALYQTGGNIQQAANLLQVPRQTLQYKIKQK